MQLVLLESGDFTSAKSVHEEQLRALTEGHKRGKRSDFSSENWVRIYSLVPEVSNVKTLTL